MQVIKGKLKSHKACENIFEKGISISKKLLTFLYTYFYIYTYTYIYIHAPAQSRTWGVEVSGAFSDMLSHHRTGVCFSLW